MNIYDSFSLGCHSDVESNTFKQKLSGDALSLQALYEKQTLPTMERTTKQIPGRENEDK